MPGRTDRAVLLNLIDNAIRHTPTGGSVIVRAVVHPGGVQIQVNDTGPRLSAATRADPPQARGRTIPPARPGRRGLVIARTIVGRMAASSGPGRSQRALLPAGDRKGGRLRAAPARGELLHYPRLRRAGRRWRKARERREAYMAHRAAVQRAGDDARMYRCQRELGNERDPAAGGDIACSDPKSTVR